MPRSKEKDTAAQAGWVSRFHNGSEPPEEAVNAVTVGQPAQWTHTSDGIPSQGGDRETRHQDLNTSEESRPSPLPLSRRGNKRRRLELLRRLQESGEEVTFTALAAAFESDDEVTDLFLTGPMKNSEDLQHYFKGRGEIDAFLTAALGPEPTSHIDAVTHRQRSVKVKDAWWATRQLRRNDTKPVRNPQADSENHFKPLLEIWADRKKTYSPFIGIQQNKRIKETPAQQRQSKKDRRLREIMPSIESTWNNHCAWNLRQLDT